MPEDIDPFLVPRNPTALPQPAQDVIAQALSGIGGSIEDIWNLPKRMLQSSEVMSQTGQYDPAPAVDMMQLMALGGMPAAEEGALGSFGGRFAKGFSRELANLAEDMERGGATPDEIWERTGYARDAAGDWKFEISDEAARIKDYSGRTYREAVSHPELLFNYPELGETRMVWDQRLGHGLYSGPHYGTIERIHAYPGEGTVKGNPKTSTLGVILHEGMHGIQEGKERFAIGANPDDPYLKAVAKQAVFEHYFPKQDSEKLNNLIRQSMNGENYDVEFDENGDLISPWRHEYHRLINKKVDALQRYNKDRAKLVWETYMRHAGEVESRNVQERWNRTLFFNRLSPELQKTRSAQEYRKMFINSRPEMTEDRPRSVQIVRKHQE